MKRVSVYIILIVFFIFLLNPKSVLAVGAVNLTSNKDIVAIDDIFTISINTSNFSAYALTTYLSFDESKVEYVSGPETSNKVDGKVIFTWYDDTGGDTPTKNNTIATFTFKAKSTGTVKFEIVGSFFAANESEITPSFSGINIEIQESLTSAEVNKNSAYLKTMRLDQEGISPIFDPKVTDYMIIIDPTIDKLNVTAIPENQNATVKVTGNTNLKNGLNKILISVTSQDSSQKLTYTISVTKTSNPAGANANLETLAIENGTLSPAFSNDVTNYYVNVLSSIESLNILAIPESQSASVKITGDKNLVFGENTITITITASDKITKKTFHLTVYRMNEEEERLYNEEQAKELEESQAIIERQSYTTESVGETNNGNINKWWIFLVLVVGLMILAGGIFIVKRKKRKKI